VWLLQEAVVEIYIVAVTTGMDLYLHASSAKRNTINAETKSTRVLPAIQGEVAPAALNGDKMLAEIRGVQKVRGSFKNDTTNFSFVRSFAAIDSTHHPVRSGGSVRRGGRKPREAE
jgi:hypothetical protein